MKHDIGPQDIKALLKNKQTIKLPAYEWQDLALRVIQELAIPKFKKNAVFKVCKNNPKPIIERALNETKELATGERWKYFFKVINKKEEIKKQQE